MQVFDRLLDDSGLLSPAVTPAAVLADRRTAQTAWYAGLLGAVVVPDTRLAELSRAAVDGAPVEVSVVNTSGAGGLVALARRGLPGLEPAAVESALRDLDDLAGNAARVVSAASELDPEITVYVEIPPGPGSPAAVEVVEAAGLCARIRVTGPPAVPGLAEHLSLLIEADLPFKVTGGSGDLVGLLAAVEALIDGADAREAEALLTLTDPVRLTAAARQWDAAARARIRRRVRRVDRPSISAAAERLTALGLDAGG